jgi:hypothetical protein
MSIAGSIFANNSKMLWVRFDRIGHVGHVAYGTFWHGYVLTYIESTSGSPLVNSS